MQKRHSLCSSGSIYRAFFVGKTNLNGLREGVAEERIAAKEGEIRLVLGDVQVDGVQCV